MAKDSKDKGSNDELKVVIIESVDQVITNLQSQLQIKDTLVTAVSAMVGVDTDGYTSDVTTHVTSAIGLMNPNVTVEDPSTTCESDSSDISTACTTYTTSETDNDHTQTKAQDATTTTFTTAIATWNSALATYDSAVSAAHIDCHYTVRTAQNEYQQKINDDSHSRSEFLAATLKTKTATALQTYETAVATATSTLASAAATLINAYATYADTTISNQLTRSVSDATAEQTFWQTVETTLDG